METTAFDTVSSQNPQGGLAPFGKDLEKWPMKAGQPGGNSLFAGMLGKTISQGTSLGPATDLPTAAAGGKLPLPAATMGAVLNGNGEPLATGMGKRRAGDHPQSPTGNDKPLKGIVDETAAEMINPLPASAMEKTTGEEAPMPIHRQPAAPSSAGKGDSLPLAGPVGKKSGPLTEKAEPTEDAKTANHVTAEMMGQVIATPVTFPDAGPPPAEKATRQSAPPHEPEAALFAQAIEADEPATGKPAREEAAFPVSQGLRPQSGRHTDTRSLLEGAERRAEPALVQPPAETPQLKKEGAAPDVTSARNPMAAAAASASPASQEVRPLSDRHADPRSFPEGVKPRMEPAVMQRQTEILQLKKEKPATDDALADVRQTSPSHHDNGKRVGESKGGASIAAAPQKPISPVNEGDAPIGQAAAESMATGESAEKALSSRDAVTKILGSAQDHPANGDTASNHQARHTERDMFPFRMVMPHVASPQETKAAATLGATGIEMQSVIDQILEARQVAGNDFGRVRILLSPPSLGNVDLDIVVRGERIGVVMTAENATVQQALQSRGDDIRIALQRHDLKIEGFQVLLQDHGTDQQQTNSGAMYRQDRENRGSRERFNTHEDGPPAFPLLSSIIGEKTATGRVSIFA